MIAVVGATGFVGKNLVKTLADKGERVRALVRDEQRARRILVEGEDLELAIGDMHDEESVARLLEGVRAIYVLVQTITTPQSLGPREFREAERDGLETIVRACRRVGVERFLTLGLIGAQIDSARSWPRARAGNEEYLLDSGLDVTVLRPGLIVGAGGQGFDMLLVTASRRVSPILGSGHQKWSYLAIDDVVGYLVDALDDPGTFGRGFDIGSTEAPSYRELVGRLAQVLGRRPPLLIGVPLPLLRKIAPLLERIQKIPRGGLAAAIEHDFAGDLVGDTEPIREILPRTLSSWEEAVSQVITSR